MKSALLILQILLLSYSAGAQRLSAELIGAQSGVSSTEAPELEIRAVFRDSFTRVPPPPVSDSPTPTATIDVTYIGFPASAQTAFEYAVGIWEGLLTSSVTVNVIANWTSLDPGVLGSASASSVWRNFAGAPETETWYPVALAEKLSGGGLNHPDTADIEANFNSTLGSWYFGTDGNPPTGQFDMVSVVLHELGHGLGFFGSFNVNGGNGSWGAGSGFPFIFDRFAENGSGQQLITAFSNNSSALATQLTSNNIFFDGTNANGANGGTPPKLYTPSTWAAGSSFSHLDETLFPPGSQNSLMTPSIGTAEAIHSPGAVCLGMFEDWGWTTTPPPPTEVKWEEKFISTTIPAGWRVVDNDGSGSALMYSQGVAFTGGDTVRAQTGASFWFSSWTNANGSGLIDEWLIGPRVPDITTGDTLYFWAGAVNEGFNDSLRVFISTSDSSLGSFTNQIGYFKVDGPVGSWHLYGFDLSQFAGSDVFVAVNYFIVDGGANGAHSDNVWIDHFLISSMGSGPPLTVTTSVLQNPALSRYADIVVVSDVLLQNTPLVDVSINTSTTPVPLSLIPGADRTYSGSYEFTQSGTYTLATTTTDSGLQATFTRTFGVVLARPGIPVAIESTDGQATLSVLESSITDETYFLSDYSLIDGEAAYQFGPMTDFPNPLLLEMSYDPVRFPDPEGLAIYWKGNNGWERLASQVAADRIKAFVSTLGYFRIGYDAGAVNDPLTPGVYSLEQNYPNPFNPSTVISFEVGLEGPVTLTLYDIQGRSVKTLYDGHAAVGRYEVSWDGTDRSGNHVASGVYFYRLTTDSFVQTQKLVLLR